jgi:hypothetical protein
MVQPKTIYRGRLSRHLCSEEQPTLDQYMLSLRKRLHTLEQMQNDGLSVEITSTQLIVSTFRSELAPKYGLKKERVKVELTREAMRAARNWLHITQKELS